MNWTLKNKDTEQVQKDPRIDSPHIKVVYPTKEIETEQSQNFGEQNGQENEEPTPLVQSKAPVPTSEVKNVSEQVQTPSEPHTCKLSFQDAIKAHSAGFILIALGILALGFIIGKNKV